MIPLLANLLQSKKNGLCDSCFCLPSCLMFFLFLIFLVFFFFLRLFLHVELDGRMRKKRLFRVGTCRFPFFFTPSADTWLCNSALWFGMDIWRGYLIYVEYWLRYGDLCTCELLLPLPLLRRYYCFEVSDLFTFLWPASIHVQYPLSFLFLYFARFCPDYLCSNANARAVVEISIQTHLLHWNWIFILFGIYF